MYVVDAVSYYLNRIFAPRLRGYGVSESFLLYTIGVIHTQMTSLLRHWDDRVFKNTVLLLGMEEGSFYEPPAKIDIRCFVVVTIRNSPIETIQSDAYADAGLSKLLPSKEVKEITSEAICYFSKQDFAAMCSRAKLSKGQDLYRELANEYPVAWAALQHLAATNSRTVDYPKVSAEPYFLEGMDKETGVTVVPGEMKIGIYDGYTPEIEPPLMEFLKMLSDDPNGVLLVDSLKSVTRNIAKLLSVLEFVLTRDLAFASTNYYMENGHIERRMKPLRAGHGTSDIRRNLSNTSGLGYKHKAALSRYTTQAKSTE